MLPQPPSRRSVEASTSKARGWDMFPRRWLCPSGFAASCASPSTPTGRGVPGLGWRIDCFWRPRCARQARSQRSPRRPPHRHHGEEVAITCTCSRNHSRRQRQPWKPPTGAERASPAPCAPCAPCAADRGRFSSVATANMKRDRPRNQPDHCTPAMDPAPHSLTPVASHPVDV